MERSIERRLSITSHSTDKNDVSDSELYEVDLLYVPPPKRALKAKLTNTEGTQVTPSVPNERELPEIRLRSNVVTQELKKLHVEVCPCPDQQLVFSFEEAHEILTTHEFLNGYHVRRKYRNSNGSAGYECSGKKSLSKDGLEPCKYTARFKCITLSNGAKTIMIDKSVEHNHPPNLEVPFQQRKTLGVSQLHVVDIIIYPCLLTIRQKKYLLEFFQTMPCMFASYTLEQALMEYFNWALNDNEARKAFSTWNPHLWVQDPLALTNLHRLKDHIQRRAVLCKGFIKNFLGPVRA